MVRGLLDRDAQAVRRHLVALGSLGGGKVVSLMASTADDPVLR